MTRSSKISGLFFLILFYVSGNCYGQKTLTANIHRILFLGDSITYAGSYVTDIETYYIVHYPDWKFEFINAGLSSETVSGLSEEGHAGGKFPRPDLHERLERVLAVTKPDLVLACYGMNDGIYLPFDESRFQKFKDGLNWLHDRVVRSGAKIIHLTPPVYDELKGKKTGYSAVLDKYADWLIDQNNKSQWKVADIHFPMKRFLEAHRKVDADFSLAGFALAEDGVHPNEVGHWIIAKNILLYLGEKNVAAAADVKTAIAINPNGEKILKLVSERQAMMKDAWLTAAGHKRPGMKAGLPLRAAEARADEIAVQIQTLIQNL